MKLRFLIVAGAVVVVAVAVGGIAMAALDGDDDAGPVGVDGDMMPECGELAGVCGTVGGPGEPEVVLEQVTGADRFVGLTAGDAATMAEAEGRPWRVGRTDDESFVLTDDLVVGRLTFEIDDGAVTSARIEVDVPPVGEDDLVEDPARSALLAKAVLRLLTVDNMFAAGDPFDDIRIAAVMSGDPNQPLQALDLEMIAAAVSEVGTVTFIDDFSAETRALFEPPPDGAAVVPGVAVVSIDGLLLLDDRAEVKLSLWCGSMCGVYLTYEAVPRNGMWDITGISGPIAVS